MFAGTALSVRLFVYAGLSLFIIYGPYLYVVVCVFCVYNLTLPESVCSLGDVCSLGGCLLPGGVSALGRCLLLGGVCSWGGLLPGRVCSQGGFCSQGGVFPGGCLLQGVSAQGDV